VQARRTDHLQQRHLRRAPAADGSATCCCPEIPVPTKLQARARVAALSRHRTTDDPELSSARADLLAAGAEDYIRKLVDSAPPLTPEMRSRLAVLLLATPGGEAT
jgi:hypothetical protein